MSPAPAVERLSDTRIQEFLASKEVVVLATLQPDGSPLVTPMWFLHGPDTITMISVADTRKVKNLRRDPRVCVVAESGARGAEIRSVTVAGRAELVADGSDRSRLAGRLLDKYHPHLEALWGARAMPADRVMFHVVPGRVRSRGL